MPPISSAETLIRQLYDTPKLNRDRHTQSIRQQTLQQQKHEKHEYIDTYKDSNRWRSNGLKLSGAR
jgi:hypothetical protein